jgi:pyrroloquinoline quinone (PQQ) biosynthesis protein C
MRALADALSVHFPHFRHEPYFEECFSQRVEERHAAEALEMTQMVLRARPELLDETLRDARIIAEALDGVWAHLDRIVRHAQATAAPDGNLRVRRQPGTRRPAVATAQDEALLSEIATRANEIC